MKQKWWKLWPALTLLSICFGLFQNFSLDNEYKDIRQIAPAGVPNEAASGYFAGPTRATSLTGLGNEFLKHNLNDDLKQLENRFEDWSGIELHGRSNGAAQTTAGRGLASVSSTAEGPASYKLRTGLLGRDRVGIRFESDIDIRCEYSALSKQMQLSLDKTLSDKASLSIRHTTEDHNSTVNFTYNW